MKRTPLILFLLLATAVLLSTCTQSGPCEGSLTLENPIPDITVAVGDTLFIDLADPPVFVSSEGKISYLPSIRQGHNHVQVNQIANSNDNERLSILIIIGESVGEAVVELMVSSSCLENNYTYNITVIEQ